LFILFSGVFLFNEIGVLMPDILHDIE